MEALMTSSSYQNAVLTSLTVASKTSLDGINVIGFYILQVYFFYFLMF